MKSVCLFTLDFAIDDNVLNITSFSFTILAYFNKSYNVFNK